MPRSQAVREECIRLDGNRCQITGADAKVGALLEVHHVIALGMGGSDELDTVENCITLEAHIHQMVESGALVIARWEREHVVSAVCLKDGEEISAFDEWDTIKGTTRLGVLEIIDNQDVLGHGIGKVDHSLLWFYRRKDAEEGEEILSQLSSFAMLDATIAERVHRLGQVVEATDPDSRSLRECLASKGLDTSRLISAARLWGKSIETGVEWPGGMTVSDYRRMLREGGHGSKREYFYVQIPHRSWLTGARPEVYYRTAYEQELRETMEIGDRLYKLAKTVYGLRAENGRLIRPDGSEEPFIRFVPKGN